MFKKIFLAAAFMGMLAFAGLGTASTANADVCYGRGGGFGGGFSGYGGGFGGPSFYRGGGGYRGYGGRGFSSSRRFDRGFGYGPYDYGRRGRGVSLRIGF